MYPSRYTGVTAEMFANFKAILDAKNAKNAPRKKTSR